MISNFLILLDNLHIQSSVLEVEEHPKENFEVVKDMAPCGLSAYLDNKTEISTTSLPRNVRVIRCKQGGCKGGLSRTSGVSSSYHHGPFAIDGEFYSFMHLLRAELV